MELQHSADFDPDLNEPSFFESIPPQPAVFALFSRNPDSSPYLSRTRDLRRRLRRLLGVPGAGSRRLNLRAQAGRVEYSLVGSGFEAQWWLYALNKLHYSKVYRQRLRLRPPALLKLNLSNRFPRLFPTRRISNDDAVYYGPFRSRVEAERWAAEFLDLFRIRRCVEDLIPDPSHPGCIYSQMHMCLAPCFAGCTDQEYASEVGRVAATLEGGGRPLLRTLESERAQAAESLEFEQAAKVHRQLEKVQEIVRSKPDLVHNLRELHAVIVEPGAEPNSVAFFRVSAGMLSGPAILRFDENVSSPVSLDEQLHYLLDSLASRATSPGEPAATTPTGVGESPRQGHEYRRAASVSAITAGEHLSLLARWYYSSFREGELVMLPPNQQIPHARLIRVCRKILAGRTE